MINNLGVLCHIRTTGFSIVWGATPPAYSCAATCRATPELVLFGSALFSRISTA
jgi:hypothetical protein